MIVPGAGLKGMRITWKGNSYEGIFFQKVKRLPKESWSAETVRIRPIENDDDLWYAVVECELTPEQEEFVNPAGFSIGRAYLDPRDNVPCVICKTDGERIGYIVFRKWSGEGRNFNWSYYIDKKYQGQGYGKAAARLAVKILKAVDPDVPIKLSAEASNVRAQELYRSVGFKKTDELDGDDLVFVL